MVELAQHHPIRFEGLPFVAGLRRLWGLGQRGPLRLGPHSAARRDATRVHRDRCKQFFSGPQQLDRFVPIFTTGKCRFR
jgi:hypothetical protein